MSAAGVGGAGTLSQGNGLRQVVLMLSLMAMACGALGSWRWWPRRMNEAEHVAGSRVAIPVANHAAEAPAARSRLPPP